MIIYAGIVAIISGLILFHDWVETRVTGHAWLNSNEFLTTRCALGAALLFLLFTLAGYL